MSLYVPKSKRNIWFDNKNFILNGKKNNRIKAILTPHAGLKYSGQIAAEAYSQIEWNNYDQIIMLSTHHSSGNYLPKSSRFYLEEYKKLFNLNDLNLGLQKDDSKFTKEHSWLMQMPFLPETKPICIILIGDYNPNLSTIINNKINDKTLLIVNTDLLHCDGQFVACPPNIDEFNRNTINTIINFGTDFETNSMCGTNAVKIFIDIARMRNFKQIETKYTTSREIEPIGTSVGYATILFESEQLGGKEKINLLEIPRRIMEMGKLWSTTNRNIGSLVQLFKTQYTWDGLPQKYGIFVTIEKYGKLRGCIGTFNLLEVGESIANRTLMSAFKDNRFNPIEKTELLSLTYKVNFLKKPRIIYPNKNQIPLDSIKISGFKFGIKEGHGITIYFGNRSATYLASVLVESFKIKNLEDLKIRWNELKESLFKKSGSITRLITKIESYYCKEFNEQETLDLSMSGGFKRFKVKVKKLY